MSAEYNKERKDYSHSIAVQNFGREVYFQKCLVAIDANPIAGGFQFVTKSQRDFL